jgi:hypothetical protein
MRCSARGERRGCKWNNAQLHRSAGAIVASRAQMEQQIGCTALRVLGRRALGSRPLHTMNYYLKSPKASKVQGPHSLQEINQRLEDGSLSSEWSATADLGEGAERVEGSRPTIYSSSFEQGSLISYESEGVAGRFRLASRHFFFMD